MWAASILIHQTTIKQIAGYCHVRSRFVRTNTLYTKSVKIHRKWELLRIEYTPSFYSKPLLQLLNGMIPFVCLRAGNRILIAEEADF
jgi:hypothetical protein